MKQLTILIGPPGSGKSTYSKTLKDTLRINQDEAGKDHLRLFIEAIATGKDIVIDRMNFNKQQRSKYIDPANAAGYLVHAIVFQIPRKVCFERCVARKDHETIKDPQAAKSAINLFFSKYERPEVGEVYSVNVINYGGGVGEDKPKAIICDLDGTLCNIDHRLHYVKKNVEGRKPNWPAFFKGIPRDGVNDWCAELVRQFSGTHEILFCSGRGEESREDTEKWLKDHNLYFGHLFMRSAGDHRQDNIIKEILLDFDILTQFQPIFAVDDRKQVVDMWRSRGIVCLQCAEGNF